MSNKEAIRPILKILDTTGHFFSRDSYQLAGRLSTEKRASSKRSITVEKQTSHYYSEESRFDYFGVADHIRNLTSY